MKSLVVSKKYIESLSYIDRKKHLQKTRLLKFIYINGPKSNIELSSELNISLPTSAALLSELSNDGLIEISGTGVSIGGRKPKLHSLKSESLYALSVDIGFFKTKIAVIDNNNNNITGIHTYELKITKDRSAIDKLHLLINTLIDNYGIDKQKLIGVGVSMPGLIDPTKGNNYSYLYDDKDQKSLKEVLEDKFKLSVFIQNDVKNSALAESRFGLAKDKSNVLVILLDWGIGLGAIIDGKICSGTSGFFGEIGHIPFIEGGELCYCGKRGCLETVASGIAMAKRAKEGIKSGQDSILNELSGYEIDKIEPHLIIDAANRGDQYAISILSEFGNNLGKGLSILIQLFNPELIILGGKMAEAKQYITIPVQQSINTYCMTQIREKVQIVLSDLAQDASILGSACSVFENVMENQIQIAIS